MKRGCLIVTTMSIATLLALVGCRMYTTARTKQVAVWTANQLFELCKTGDYAAAVRRKIIGEWSVRSLKASDIAYGRVISFKIGESLPGPLVIPLWLYVDVKRERQLRRELVIQHGYMGPQLQYEAESREAKWREAYDKLGSEE